TQRQGLWGGGNCSQKFPTTPKQPNERPQSSLEELSTPIHNLSRNMRVKETQKKLRKTKRNEELISSPSFLAFKLRFFVFL
ncbi:MAG: hypothetical protein V3V10_05895, partial [Planctomycetota bacterium]